MNGEIQMSKVAMRFGEVILKTAQYDALKSWYCRVLDTEPMIETERTTSRWSDAALLYPTRFGFSFFHYAGNLRCARIAATGWDRARPAPFPDAVFNDQRSV
jgi:hypothetical protein